MNGSSFEQTWIPFHQRMHCGRVQWFLRKRFFFLNFVNVLSSYFVIIALWKRAGLFIWTNLNPLHSRMLYAKFGWNWPRGSVEDENMKSLCQWRLELTTDKFWSEKLTWAQDSGELKRLFLQYENILKSLLQKPYIRYFLFQLVY